MSKYYFNENPQVRHWMGKCAKLEQEIDMLNEKLDDAVFEVEDWKSRYKANLSAVDFWCGKWEDESKEKETAFKQFNSLPWYKKIFFKFKI